jgi:hypothetical protein
MHAARHSYITISGRFDDLIIDFDIICALAAFTASMLIDAIEAFRVVPRYIADAHTERDDDAERARNRLPR